MVNFVEFQKRAKEIHGGKYLYDENSYKNTHEKVRIICPIHGEFWQTPHDHLRGHGCKECASVELWKKRGRVNTESFIEKSKQIHGNKYDYSKVNYVKNDVKVCIICPQHGEFWQRPSNHLKGQGCPCCTNNKRLTTEECIERAREVHGDKYDYSKVKYVSMKRYIDIICPIHGEFKQTPDVHIRMKCDCPKCSSSKLEKEVRELLTENGIEFVEQKRFEWLNRQSFDFYLPQYNTAIECQGIQHFENRTFGSSKESNMLAHQVELDELKREKSKENGVKLLYYSNLGIVYPYNVYENKEEILKEICQERS